MITLPRILTAPLVIVLPLLLMAALLGFQINATFAQPDFYIDELRRARVYAFLYDEAIPEAIAKGMERTGELPLGLELSNEEMASAVRQIAPPQWTQQQVEHAFSELAPYLIGAEQTFQIVVLLDEPADLALEVLKEELQGQAAVIHANIFDELIPQAVDERLAQHGDLPFGLDLTGTEIGAALKEAMPPNWASEQVGLLIDGAGPYLIGRQVSFSVTIPLEERSDALLGVVKELLSDADLHDFLVQDFILPAIEDALEGAPAGAPGVRLSGEEVVAAVVPAVSTEWLEEQTGRVIDSAGPYLIGQEDEFEANISLVDLQGAAAEAVATLAQDKLIERFHSLPTCMPDQTAAQLSAIHAGRFPACQPPVVPMSDLRAVAKAQAAPASGIAERIPDTVVFTEADLRGALDESSLALLDRSREVISQGWTFTDEDLRSHLDPDSLRVLDRLRETLREDFTFTDQDLSRRLQDAGRQDTVEALDRVRGWIGLLRQLRYLFLPLIAALLVGIGFLGGRSWPDRLAWAGGALALSSLIVYVGGGIAMGSLFEAVLPEVASQGEQGFSYVVSTKALEIVADMTDRFRSAVTIRALLLFIAGMAALGGGLAWRLRARRSGAGPVEAGPGFC